MISSSRSRSSAAFFVTALGTFWVTLSAAQSPLGAAVAGMTAHEVLGEASKAASAAIDHAGVVGNGLLSSGASQLAVLEQNAGLIIGSNMDKLGRDLSGNEGNLLGQVYVLTNEVRQAKDGAYRLKDSAAIDMASLAATGPFMNVPYFIQGLEGLAYVDDGTDHDMLVTAYGITPATAGSASAVTVTNTKTGAAIPARVSVVHKGEARVTFAEQTLAPFFDAKKVVILPVSVTVTVSDERRFLGIPYWPKVTPITAKVALSLFPKVAGSVEVMAFVPQYAWKSLGTVETAHQRAGDGEPTRILTQPITVPGGLTSPHMGWQHLENPQWHCRAWFSKRADVCGYEAWWRMIAPPGVSDDGTRASWSFSSDGESREWWLSAEKFVYDYTSDRVDTKTYDVLWGQARTFDLPSGYSHYLVTGRTITKQPISLTLHESMEGFMTYLGVTQEPDPTLSYEIGRP